MAESTTYIKPPGEDQTNPETHPATLEGAEKTFSSTYTMPVSGQGQVNPPVHPEVARRSIKVLTADPPDSPTGASIEVIKYGPNETIYDSETNEPGKLPSAVLSGVLAGNLVVTSIDVQNNSNRVKHHTDRFPLNLASQTNLPLVVRRGQRFRLKIKFSRPYNPEKDELKLVFKTGFQPLSSRGTYVEIIPGKNDKSKDWGWGAKVVNSTENVADIDVYTPSNCYVAKWALHVDVVVYGPRTFVYKYFHPDHFYVLFNPWFTGDEVYMKDQNLLHEYIFNEVGKIFTGTRTSITSKPWNFGQFEAFMLDVAMYLLDVSKLNPAVRGDPAVVVRKLAHMITDPNDGVIIGSWTGNYQDGTSPLTWTGSVGILEEYWKNKHPVKYGQCWVFAGVLATVCKTLGIPTRCVTNFSSAQDVDGSMTIDTYITPDGEVDYSKTVENIWTFHVWNECWMTRHDLPPGCEGWQLVDATPQGTSQGFVYCGPTSVSAIQKGEVSLPYDGSNVFARLHADHAYWFPNRLGVLECVHINANAAGQYISTKAVNSIEREDITSSYKFPSGSTEEMAALFNAKLVGKNRLAIYKLKTNDVKFGFVHNPQQSLFGKSFSVELKIKNVSDQQRTIRGRINVSCIQYTGLIGHKLKSQPFENIVVQPGGETLLPVQVTADEYDSKMKDGVLFEVFIWAQVEETDQKFARREYYRLRKPHLQVKVPSEISVQNQFKIDVQFTNPVKLNLTNCFITVDGACWVKKFPQGNVSPNGTFITTLDITPNKPGHRELIVSFSSEQVDDIYTTCSLRVQGKSDTTQEFQMLAKEEFQPVAKEEVQPVAKEEVQPVAKEEVQPVAREGFQIDAEEDFEPVAEEECQPVTKEERQSVAEKEYQPVAEEECQPVTKEERQSVAEEECQPVAEEERQSVAEEERQPVTKEERQSVAEEERQPVTKEECQPVDKEECQSVTKE